MTVDQWKKQYQILFEMIVDKNIDNSEYNELVRGMNEENWNKFTQEEQMSIYELGNKLYKEHIHKNENI